MQDEKPHVSQSPSWVYQTSVNLFLEGLQLAGLFLHCAQCEEAESPSHTRYVSIKDGRQSSVASVDQHDHPSETTLEPLK